MTRLAAVLALAASPAVAQNIPPAGGISLPVPCFPTEALAADMGERGMWPAERGAIVTSAGMLIAQVWRNSDTGEWAWVVVNAHGQSCQVASGEMLEDMPEPPKGEAM